MHKPKLRKPAIVLITAVAVAAIVGVRMRRRVTE